MLECIKCNLKYYNLNNKLCEFCNIVYNLKKTDSYKYIICQTKISQYEIIKKTYEYFIKNDKMPLPNEIDKESIIISVNPYYFISNIKNDNYKIFYTNCIDRNNIKVKKYLNKYPNEKININNYLGVDLKNIDENTYNEYINIINI